MKLDSIQKFTGLSEKQHDNHLRFLSSLNALFNSQSERPDGIDESVVYVRNPEIKGPMSGFGYSWLSEHLDAEIEESLKLPDYTGLWGSGGDYAYEALNLVDGKRSVQEIRNWLTAELGPVDIGMVSEYLDALSQTGLLQVREQN